MFARKLHGKAIKDKANQGKANQGGADQGIVKREPSADDEGSITPLIVLYFIVIMSSIFFIDTVASEYFARRKLSTVTCVEVTIHTLAMHVGC